ncbi:uncharacterized protein LOC111206840 [Brassica napus]|uniref:uncharacterized protein LOC111206840 n=1 Tax=Brassica napus TaxID=3708 RepID=UPI000BBE975E|nr:uncharacterized protein LOC111206840 [Brassica napus]
MDTANPPGILNPLEDRSVIMGEDKKESTVEKQERSSILTEEKSWVSAAQDKKSLRKYEVEISTQDGKNKVVIPDEVLANSTPLWDDFIVGKFLDLAPHMAKVHMVVNKIWKYGELESKVDVYDVNATMMRFRISNPKAREKILKRGMWNIAGVPMVVTKWTPKTEEEKQEETAIPMLIHLRKVPLHMYSWQGLSFMTSTVGFPDRLHPETIACTNLEEAKVFVNVDVSKPLPKEIDFTKEGKEFAVEFHYPWFPSKCNLWSKWGHTEKVCVMNGKEKRRKEAPQELRDASGAKTVAQHSPIEEGKQEIVPTVKSPQIVENDKLEEDAVSVQKESKVSNWSLVSPTKVGRSQSPQGHAPEVQISASKFSVLSVDVSEEVEEGEFLVEDQEDNEEEELEISEKTKDLEEDQIEDDILAQQSRGKDKVGAPRGRRRGQKAKALDANPLKIKEWIRNKDMKFGCLLETRIKERNAERIMKEVEERKELWEDLCNHHNSAMFKNKEWVIMRDFNKILDGEKNSRFERLRTLPRGFLPMVEEYWKTTKTLFHSTSAMYRFSKKLKQLKPMIRELGRNGLGNLTKRTKEAYEKLCDKQRSTLANPGEVATQKEAEAYEKWLHVANLEEDFLKQPEYQGATEDELKDNLDFRCSLEDCSMLEAEVTKEEIHKVLFAMPASKSPGPDGFPCEFFKTTWFIIGHDFTVAIQSVFKFGFLPKGVNSTILALIPKKTDSMEMRDYMPIVL